MTPGFVSLVGAGLGAPDLLTVRALDRLRAADLVLYDALVAPAVIALATHAQRFSVGKRAGRKSVRQETITRVMVRAARRGRRVVRLKCGDPYVLGRGGEEALALRSAGVQFEVVQGLTAAVAAPALAGIPVTHRGLASGFLVVSGHDTSSYEPVLGSLAPGTVTVVVLMGLANRQAIAACLLERGWPHGTAAAVLFAASTPGARTWVGTLADLATAPDATDSEDPGTIVVGDVVNLHTALAADGETLRSVETPGEKRLALP
jgi:uroporphyrin-III C-methyltransferase